MERILYTYNISVSEEREIITGIKNIFLLPADVVSKMATITRGKASGTKLKDDFYGENFDAAFGCLSQ